MWTITEELFLFQDSYPLPRQAVPVFSLNSKQNRKFVIFVAFKCGSCLHESIWFSWIKSKPWTFIWKVSLGKFVYKGISCSEVWYENSHIFQLLSSWKFSSKNISAYSLFQERNLNHERFHLVSFPYKTQHISFKARRSAYILEAELWILSPQINFKEVSFAFDQ